MHPSNEPLGPDTETVEPLADAELADEVEPQGDQDDPSLGGPPEVDEEGDAEDDDLEPADDEEHDEDENSFVELDDDELQAAIDREEDDNDA